MSSGQTRETPLFDLFAPVWFLDVEGAAVVHGVVRARTWTFGEGYSYRVVTLAGEWYEGVPESDLHSGTPASGEE